MKPRKLQKLIWRLTLVLCVAGLFYLPWRFELLSLPSEGCSPLLRYRPGQRLLVDRRPGRYAVGDAVFFVPARGAAIWLASVREKDAQSLQLEVDNPACPLPPGFDSGRVTQGALRGRVVMPWPFSP